MTIGVKPSSGVNSSGNTGQTDETSGVNAQASPVAGRKIVEARQEEIKSYNKTLQQSYQKMIASNRSLLQNEQKNLNRYDQELSRIKYDKRHASNAKDLRDLNDQEKDFRFKSMSSFTTMNTLYQNDISAYNSAAKYDISLD